MADPNDGWDEEEEWEDEEETADDSGNEHWSEDDDEYSERQRRVAQRTESASSARPESREERYARRNEVQESPASSSAASSSSSSSSSTPSSGLSALERMRLATEERERGRAAAISERERGPEPHVDAPNPFMTKFEAVEKAKRNAPGLKLTSPQIFEGRKFYNKLKKITDKYNNPHVVFEMETFANDYKILSLAIDYLNEAMEVNPNKSSKEKIAYSQMAEDIFRLRKERRSLSDYLEREERDNSKRWSKPFVSVPIQLPNIKTDCRGETNSLRGEPLIQGRCVRLSDGMCYNFDDIIAYYKASPDKLNLKSPFTRGAFTKKDIDMILTLIQQGHTGGKRTRRNKTKKMRKTRVR